MQQLQTPGSFADGTFHDGAVHGVTTNTDVQVFRVDGDHLTLIASRPCGGSGFARIESVGGQLWIAYRPQTGTELKVENLTTGEGRSYPGLFYNWPVCFGRAGYALTAYAKVNGVDVPTTTIYSYAGEPVTILSDGRPDGINRVTDTNSAVLWNADTFDDEIGWGIVSPEYAGQVMGGEDHEGGIALVYQSRVKIVVNPGSETFKPKVWEGPVGVWNAATTGHNYATALFVTGVVPADFEAVTVPPIDPPVDPPPAGSSVTAVVVNKPMFYANGDMKTTIRTTKDALPKLKKGDTIQVMKP